MKNLKIFLFLSTLIYFFGNRLILASEKEYNVNKIPADLKLDADAVVRNKTTIFEIQDEASAVKSETLAVTIFNKDGQSFGDLSLYYNKFSDIDELDGKILDADGEEIRELESKDIKDHAAISNFSLYDDSRIKEAELYYDKFPYTIVFTYKISYDGYINWPSWYSRTSLDPVEFSKFQVIVPENYKLRYWCNRDSVRPEISEEGKVFSWHAENLEKLSYDAVGEDIEDVATIVKIAPSAFEIEGFKGNMNSWNEFGLWMYNLYKDKDFLSEDAVNRIKTLVSPNDNTKIKVIKLYEYLQSHTRYVSVQLGIGGWQPFDAMYVYEKGYGDCKALSNYMISLLKVNGITAYPVLINNGDRRMPLITEFPSNQFNHVIVCVPLEIDTIWLECTSRTALPGDISWGNENRDALMLTGTGGVIVRTPVSTSTENLMQKKIEVVFASGTASITGIINWRGDQQNSVRSIIKEDTPEDQEKWILKSFEVPDVRIRNYSFKTGNDSTGNVSLNLNLTLPKYATISGDRIFFNPNIMQRRTYVPNKVAKRLSPVRFSYPYHDVDSIYYKTPDGFAIEALPDEMNVVSSFGNFSLKVIKQDQGILYIRSLEIKDYQVPAENYNEYREFFAEVAKADRSQVVLVKK